MKAVPQQVPVRQTELKWMSVLVLAEAVRLHRPSSHWPIKPGLDAYRQGLL